MGDDFEVAVPDDLFQRFVLKPQSGVLEPQSGTIVADSQSTDELDAPQQEQACIVGLPPVEDPNLNKVFFGESITSFRTVLKRYMLWNTIAKLSTARSYCVGRFPAFPYLRGNVSGAVDTTAALAPYNYCNTVLLHWVRCAFSGSRGSIRYKIVPRGAVTSNCTYEVSRAPYRINSPSYYSTTLAMPTYTTTSEARYGIIADWQAGTASSLPVDANPLPGYRGKHLTTAIVNNTLEFEMPYYSHYRFTPGKPQDTTSIQTFEGAWDYRIEDDRTGSSAQNISYDVYVAAGEDFQTYFFTGLPRMYYESSPPAA